jgi:phosphatidate cytidylyltransferase
LSSAFNPAELRVRIAAAAVLIPVALVLAWAGGLWFKVLLVAAGWAMAWEWCAMVHPSSRTQLAILGCAVPIAALAPDVLTIALAVAVLAGAWFAAVVVAWRERSDHRPWLFLGVPYVTLPILSLAALRADPQFGLLAVLWLLAAVWSADVGAYFAGRLIGGPKLAPAISPNKTWAGLGGATAGAAAAGLIVAWAAGLSHAAVTGGLGATMGVVEQGGDLLESAAKRAHGRKDTGKLIPGHGGILDRVDGLMTASIVAFLIGALRAGPDKAATGLLSW